MSGTDATLDSSSGPAIREAEDFATDLVRELLDETKDPMKMAVLNNLDGDTSNQATNDSRLSTNPALVDISEDLLCLEDDSEINADHEQDKENINNSLRRHNNEIENNESQKKRSYDTIEKSKRPSAVLASSMLYFEQDSLDAIPTIGTDELELKLETEPKIQPEAKTGSEPVPKMDSEIEPKMDSDPEPNFDSETDPNTQSGPEPKTVSEPDMEPELKSSKPQSDIEPESQQSPVFETEPALDSKLEPELEAEMISELGLEPESSSLPEPQVTQTALDLEPTQTIESEPVQNLDQKPESQSETEPESAQTSKSELGPSTVTTRFPGPETEVTFGARSKMLPGGVRSDDVQYTYVNLIIVLISIIVYSLYQCLFK